MIEFDGRLGIVQRVLPRYRAPFFDQLAAQCRGGLSVFAGQARRSEAIAPARELILAQHQPTQNVHILNGPLYFCWQPGLIEWLEFWNPDVLVVEANPRYLSTPQAIRWMKTRGRPVLGWGLGAAQGGLLAGPRRSFLRQFDGLIAYSQQGAEEYRRLDLNPVFVAPNAAAPRPLGGPPQRPAPQPPLSLLFVGRLQARKGLDRLLHACASLPTDLQPELLIVGEGPARASFEALAAEVYPQAQFLGAAYGAALDTIYAQADLFVLPGTGGLAVQQAMAHALPVMVAEGDGTQADMVGPANGWLLPAGDQPALLDALEEALGDPAGLRVKGQASFALVKERFNLETMATAFINALQAVST